MFDKLPENLIPIDAADTATGIQAEYDYISALHGTREEGWVFLQQMSWSHLELKGAKPTHVDSLDIKLASGEKVTFHFDITSFYGKH